MSQQPPNSNGGWPAIPNTPPSTGNGHRPRGGDVPSYPPAPAVAPDYARNGHQHPSPGAHAPTVTEVSAEAPSQAASDPLADPASNPTGAEHPAAPSQTRAPAGVGAWLSALFGGGRRAAEQEAARQQAETAAYVARQQAARERTAMLRVLDTPVDEHAITVSALKGGITKTTLVLAIGTVLALHRRDLVLAIDGNAHRGTLASRLGEETTLTVRDLAEQLSEVSSAKDFRRFTSQAETRLEVLASERDPAKAQGFSADEYRDVVAVARRFRSVILTDTGTDLTLPLMGEVYRATDTLVVAATTARDGADLAAETLDWWAEFAGDEVVRRAVLAVTEVEPFSIRPDQVDRIDENLHRYELRCRQRREEILARFGDRVGEVIFVPYDPYLRDGGRFVWDELAPATQAAYERLGYAVARHFAGRATGK